MKINKKSQVNILTYVLVCLIILAIAVIRQPTLRAWTKINNKQMWQELLVNINLNDETLPQDLWQFREFYSRGQIYLQKNQEISIPPSILAVVKLPDSFNPYLLFTSPMLLSIEGDISENDQVFLSPQSINELGYQLTMQTATTQVITNQAKTDAVIIAVFDLEESGLANGYLHFDLRDELFKESLSNKKWLVVSLVKLKS